MSSGVSVCFATRAPELKYCRYDDNRLGVVEGDIIHDVTTLLEGIPRSGYPFPPGDQLIAHLERLRPRMQFLVGKVATRPVAEVRLLSPVANPGKIIGVPVNYQDHADEGLRDEELRARREIRPVYVDGLFLKATSSLIGPSQGVAIRFPELRTDHEAELAYVIGKGGSDIPEAEALDHIAGYAIGLDMVVRGTQDRSLRKSIDSYSVLGPWLVTADEITDPQDLELSFQVNGQTRQQTNTGRMISGIAEQIAWVSRWYTLHPGDIVMSGTPAGVSRVYPGDVMTASIAGIGSMTVKVRPHEIVRHIGAGS